MRLQITILSLAAITTFFLLDYSFNYVSDGFYYKWQFAKTSTHDMKLYVIFIVQGTLTWWGIGKLKAKLRERKKW